MDDKITDVLKRLDDDLKHTPPYVREKPLVQFATETFTVVDSTAQTIMTAVEEVEKKAADLRRNAEHVIKNLKAWANEFEAQRAQLLEQCNKMTTATNESVECVMEIGKKPIDGEAGLRPDPYPGRTRSGDMM
jgi:ABC-type transporter Mla subunit MlaD